MKKFMQTKQLRASVQLHPLSQHAAGGDGSQLGLGTVSTGHQHDRHLGAQDDTGVLGVAEQGSGLADAVAHLIVGHQQNVGVACAGAV